jgi:hypothetical protein
MIIDSKFRTLRPTPHRPSKWVSSPHNRKPDRQLTDGGRWQTFHVVAHSIERQARRTHTIVRSQSVIARKFSIGVDGFQIGSVAQMGVCEKWDNHHTTSCVTAVDEKGRHRMMTNEWIIAFVRKMSGILVIDEVIPYYHYYSTIISKQMLWLACTASNDAKKYNLALLANGTTQHRMGALCIGST